MNKSQIENTLSRAESKCIESGNKLTEKRRRILEVLLGSNIPLSAYEIADAYKLKMPSKIPVMSVYRILEFLESLDLVHKLNINSKYVACSHIGCCEGHDIPQFLICSRCESVKEIRVSKGIIEQLEKQVSSVGFKLTNSHIELECLCENCFAA